VDGAAEEVARLFCGGGLGLRWGCGGWVGGEYWDWVGGGAAAGGAGL